MKLLKSLLLPIAAIAAIFAGNSYAMERPHIRYQKPVHQVDSNEFVILATDTDNDEEVGRIKYKYLDGRIVEIILFAVNMEYRDDKKERVGQHLFQRCIDEVKAHGCETIIWTVNPTSNLDLHTVCLIYTKIVQKLTNSENYTLIKGEEYGTHNPKVDMELFFNIKRD